MRHKLLCVFFCLLASTAVFSAEDDCVVDDWRAQAYEKANKAALETRNNLIPNNPRPASQQSCLSDYSKIGVKITGVYPSTSGLLDSLLKTIVNKACRVADDWIRDMAKQAQVGINAPLGTEIDVSVINDRGDAPWIDAQSPEASDTLEDVINNKASQAVGEVLPGPQSPLDEQIQAILGRM